MRQLVHLLLIFVMIPAFAVDSVALASPNVTTAGYRSLSVPAAHRSHPLDGAVWYPAAAGGSASSFGENAVFEGVPVRGDAPPLDGKHPVILLSHGLGGLHRSLGWLAAGLAERGSIVIAVDHPDSTFGDMDMRRGLDHGTRASDLQAALAYIENDEALGSKIDAARLHVAGFSYGGWTALSMAGVRGRLDGYAAHCAAVGDRSTHCADIARAGVSLDSLDRSRWNASYRDARVRSVIAIDPGLTWGLTPDDVEGITAGMLLISLGKGRDRLLATDVDASGFTGLLPDANTLTISPAAHFSVLPLCKPAGAGILADENDDPICTDPPGSDRGAVHAAIIDAVAHAIGLI